MLILLSLFGLPLLPTAYRHPGDVGSSHDGQLHIAKLGGFRADRLNGEFRESSKPELEIGGVRTYWSTSGTVFMYYCEQHAMWYIRPKIQFASASKGSTTGGLAHSQGGSSPQLSATSPMNWTELVKNSWEVVPEAGLRQLLVICGSWSSRDECSGEKQNGGGGCMWNEAKNLCTSRWNVFTDIVTDDIGQGELGSCYFLAVLGSISFHHPKVLERMFIQKDLWSGVNPVFRTQWLVDGVRTEVSVDDQVPVNKLGQPAFVKFSSFNEAWPVVLEKAYAKMFGGFKSIENGLPSEALKAMTQAPVAVKQHWQGMPAKTLNAVWNLLSKASNKKFPMVGVSTTDAHCLASGHAYVVLMAKEISVNGTSRKALQLFNPWHWDRYCGTLVDQNDGITAELHGFFWVTLDEYIEAFSYTTIAAIQHGYRTSSRKVTLSSRGSGKLSFTVSGNQSFSALVSWPSKRFYTTLNCSVVHPEVKMAVTAAGMLSETEGNRCGWVASRPTLCLEKLFKINCASLCKRVTATTRTADQMYLGLSNIRADMPGRTGDTEYEVYIEVKIPDAYQILADHIVLSLYSAENIDIKQEISEIPFPGIYSGLAKSPCFRLIDRLATLDNWQEIRETGADSYFPANASSVAEPGANCGDSAQGISKDCSKYNTWSSFDDIMAGRAGSAPKLISFW